MTTLGFDDFVRLLQKLLSSSNEERTSAEEYYEHISPISRLELLLQAAAQRQMASELRSLTLVLCRKLIVSSFEILFPGGPTDPNLEPYKRQVLLLAVNEDDPLISKKLCEVVAELARHLKDENGMPLWPEVLKFLFEAVSSPQKHLRLTALHIISQHPGIFGNQQTTYVGVIRDAFLQCLRDSNNVDVRREAVVCVSAFLEFNSEQDDVVMAMRDTAASLLQVVAESTSSCDDDTTLKCLIELADQVPKFLRPQLNNVVTFCLKLASTPEVDDSWKHMALEVIVTLAESAPAMFRKLCLGHIEPAVTRLLEMMCDIEEDTEWSFRDVAEQEEQDEESNPYFGETSLDRLSLGLGGRAMMQPLINAWQLMLRDSRWQARHAALMAISACGEGCKKQMEGLLEQLVSGILPFSADQHPRVRYAVCNALGQMATDFGPLFQKKFHDKVIPSLLGIMDDFANPRVQAHAGAALVNFSEDCPPTIMAPYLDAIISKIETVLQARFQELLQRGNKLVLEQFVTTLAAVADSAEERFLPYYDRFMPMLKYILQNATHQTLRLLRGKTIECVSLIGLAVGKEKFSPDANDVMQVLLAAQTTTTPSGDASGGTGGSGGGIAADDPQLAYMMSAWARMCRLLGRDFCPFLPIVMPSLLDVAGMKPDVAVLSQQEAKELETDEDWQVVNLGDQQNVGIRTTGLEEKAQAFQMLLCYARELSEGFVEYVDRVARLAVTHLKFYFHEGVRTSAAETLPALIDSAKSRSHEFALQIWSTASQQLLGAIDAEMELTVLGAQLGALAECVETLERGCLSTEQLTTLSALLCKILDEHLERQSDRQQQRASEDYDESVEETLQEEDENDVYVLTKVSDVLHSLFFAYRADYLPYFEPMALKFAALLQPTQPWADRQWAICVFDDVVEFASPQSAPALQLFGTRLVESISDRQPEVRQAAAYGIGILSRYGPVNDALSCQIIADSIPRLMAAVAEPNARTVEAISATENCISAIAKIVRYRNYQTEQLLPIWFSWLPIWDDEEECECTYDYLCELVQANNPLILAPDGSGLVRVVQIFGQVLERGSVVTTGPTGQRIIGLLNQLKSSANIFQACMSQLPPGEQNAILAALQTLNEQSGGQPIAQ